MGVSPMLHERDSSAVLRTSLVPGPADLTCIIHDVLKKRAVCYLHLENREEKGDRS